MIFDSIRIAGFIFAVTAASFAGPLSPEESLKQFEIDPNFKIEIFAAEPHIVDPVVTTFDEFGRIYVAEMREMEVLPALEPGTKATIRLIEDRDGDGRVDHSRIFADGLSFPGGLAPFDAGLYALCTPDLLYLKDTDGDGAADLKKVILTGFAQGNAEHRFNNLTWAMDNWIYAANGHGGGKVTDPSRPEIPTLDLSGRDFRFSPYTGKFESVSRGLPGGFGLAFDDWGRRYVTHNETHVMHVVLPEEALARNPKFGIRDVGEDISDHGRPDAPVFPISRPQDWRTERTDRRSREESSRFRETQLRVTGYFTAACGLTVYRADLFPPPYRGNLFVCDAAHNLVHRDLLTESGASIRASRADDQTEFLRSSDPWFRPVNLTVGPDGALYVLDFYREIIETGASIPEDILKKLDLRAGADRGRIYRITPRGDRTVFRPVRADLMADSSLISWLGDANAWKRLTAQRLLIERSSPELAAQLEDVLRGHSGLAKVHAAFILRHLGQLSDVGIGLMMDDPSPRVREQAILLSNSSVSK